MGTGKPEFGFGVHLMVDGYGCDRVALEDMNLIYNFLDDHPTRPPTFSAIAVQSRRIGGFRDLFLLRKVISASTPFRKSNT